MRKQIPKFCNPRRTLLYTLVSLCNPREEHVDKNRKKHTRTNDIHLSSINVYSMSSRMAQRNWFWTRGMHHLALTWGVFPVMNPARTRVST